MPGRIPWLPYPQLPSETRAGLGGQGDKWVCPGPPASRRRISSNQRGAEATLHAAESPQTDTHVRSHCCLSHACGRCWGRGHSHHQRGSERQNTVSLSRGGKSSEPGEGETPGADLPRRPPQAPVAPLRACHLQGARALRWHFPQSPSPAFPTSCWGAGCPLSSWSPVALFPCLASQLLFPLMLFLLVFPLPFKRYMLSPYLLLFFALILRVCSFSLEPLSPDVRDFQTHKPSRTSSPNAKPAASHCLVAWHVTLLHVKHSKLPQFLD